MRLIAALLFCLPAMAMAQNEIIISLPEHHLYVVDNDEVVADYPVGVGKASTPTPAGEYRITEIVAKPAWHVPASIMKERHAPKSSVVPPGPKNPLGVYFMRLNGSSLGIHGTTQPKLLPAAVSHGCVRMRNEDVTEVVSMVKRGTQVHIIDDVYDESNLPKAKVAQHKAAQPRKAASESAVEVLRAQGDVIEVPAASLSHLRDTQ